MNTLTFWQIMVCYFVIGLVLVFIKVLFLGKDGEEESLILLLWPVALVAAPLFIAVEGFYRFLNFAEKCHEVIKRGEE